MTHHGNSAPPVTPSKPVRIALYGGAFNPPHLGHRAVGQWLSAQPQFDEVWIVPSYRHPFDKSLAPFSHRLELCRRQFGDLPNVIVSPIENITGLSYTYDLLTHLKKTHPNYEWTLVMGSDAVAELPRWKNAEALQREFSILQIPRKGWTASPFPEYQSRDIRAAIARGEDQTHAVGADVMAYSREHRLYEGE